MRDTGLPQPIAECASTRASTPTCFEEAFELRVGAPENLALKLEVARRILAQTPVFGYLDVSVVERPVAGSTLKPQVEV